MTDVARLESVAQQLAARIRDDDPERVWAWLAAELPNPGDWFRLCCVLAAAVPTNRRWRDLVDWALTEQDRLNRRVIHKAQPELSTGERGRRPQAQLQGDDPAARLAAELLAERFGPRSEERAA